MLKLFIISISVLATSNVSPRPSDGLNLSPRLGTDMTDASYFKELGNLKNFLNLPEDATLHQTVAQCIVDTCSLIKSSYEFATTVLPVIFKGMRPLKQRDLFRAVLTNDLKMVKELEEHGSVHLDGLRSRLLPQTPLMVAAGKNLVEMVELLIDLGVSMNFMTEAGQSALSCAVGAGAVEACQVLLTRGATIHALPTGDNFLILAAKEKRCSMVRFLLGQNFLADSTGAGGMTALMYAAKNGDQATFEVLLEAGANIDVVDEEGRNALAFAYLECHEPIVWDLCTRFASHTSKEFLNCPPSSLVKYQRLPSYSVSPFILDLFVRLRFFVDACLLTEWKLKRIDPMLETDDGQFMRLLPDTIVEFIVGLAIEDFKEWESSQVEACTDWFYGD